jgi:prepilin-type N-terminal cleavage/methylation domain-containing protein
MTALVSSKAKYLVAEATSTKIQKPQAAFTLIEIMIVVLLIGLLASIAIPNFIKSRTTAQTNVCINNLKAIDYAIQQWALEQKKAANAAVQFTDISGYLRNNVTCPSGGATFADSYTISSVGVEPTCQRVPVSHLLFQAGFQVANSSDPSSSPTSSDPTSSTSSSPASSPTSSPASPATSPSSTSNGNNANNGNGNNGNGNGEGNGGIGNGNGNGNAP